VPDRNLPGQPAQIAARRVAVVDLGSNSLRLVVFERLGTTLTALLNEKVMCALGRGIARTGRLNPDGTELALSNLERFVALARALSVDHLAILATAAVREARDGPAFAAEAERRCGVPVQIIAGTEEARLSAAGVLAGIRGAHGVVADLGGGSVELVPVNARIGDAGAAAVPGQPLAGAGVPGIGAGISLPIGPLRLTELGDARKVADFVERKIAEASVLGTASGKALYLVGGAWRALGRLHMEQTHYPLHIIHEYAIPRQDAERFLEIVAGQSRRSLERITTISRKRLELLPVAALILRRLIAVARPARIVFSAFGLREGYAFGLLPSVCDDALLASCQGIAISQSRWAGDGDRLYRWIAPVFPGSVFPEREIGRRRLHRAACWLSDTAWSEHPDYRAAHAFSRTLTLPFPQISHSERVFVASALHARYGGSNDDPVKGPTGRLLGEDEAAEARALGLALRLAYTLCGGALTLLDQVRLTRDANGIALELPPTGSLFAGETVTRRLDALGRALGLPARTVRRRETVGVGV
jgi:exopolyphosphatase/guanosine-5'-triphosphate,3'-diphosphate pyrophosphatase